MPTSLRRIAAVFALAIAVTLAAATPARALFGGTLAVNSCMAGKAKCVTKLKSCLLKCHQKALAKGLAPDPGCLGKCRDKFDADPAVPGKGCFARLEAKGGCGASLGDAATFAAKVETHVAEVGRQLVPGGGNPLNKCAAGKTACFNKYDSCILKLVAKAAQKGTAIGDTTKCKQYLDLDAKHCVGKLETKYCSTSLGCTSTAPPCLTFGDAYELRNQDDALVDDAIYALVSGPRDLNTQRCSGDTSVTCSTAPGGLAGCGGPLGTCEFFFSAPLPYASSGIGICVVRQWNGSISGTFNQTTGESAGTAAVLSRIYNITSASTPCPQCNGDPFPNDGIADGTCSGGTRNGLACDGNGQSAEPSFGVTSLDCPPAGLVSTLPLDLSNSTGTITRTITVSSPNCNGAIGKKCLCASCSGDSAVPCMSDTDCVIAGAGTCTNTAGEPSKPNACWDTTLEPGDGTLCAPAGNDEGFCPEGPVDTHCALETFRACLPQTQAGDCPLAGDFCAASFRPCFPGYNGSVGDAVSVTGRPGDTRNGAAAMALGAVFCYPPTTAPAVNTFSGFPGPGRLRLAGVGADQGGPACPTEASFLPTSKDGVLDAGWSGIAHDYRMIGQAKVTVAATCTGTYPNCDCSYTGPIANPDAP